MRDDAPRPLCETPKLAGISENGAGRPAQAEQERLARRPSIAEDIQNLRVFRSNAKMADGTLDLLVPMRTGGNGPPLFCMHHMVGLSWCYIALLPHVDARYPLYGLQSRGLRRPEPLPINMEEVARDFADRIKRTALR